MANNEYRIVIDIRNLEDDKDPVAKSADGDNTVSGNNSSDSDSGGAQKVIKRVKKLVSFSAIASTAQTVAQYKISQVNLRTGASEYEARLQTQHNIIFQAVGAGTALVAGAMVGGPAGLAVAGIGVAVSAVQKFMAIQQKEETIAINQTLESISQSMYDVRAGAGSRRSSNQ